MKFTDALLNPDAIERWESAAFFNPGPVLHVLVKGRARFRMDTKAAVTAAGLRAKSYAKVHTLDQRPNRERAGS